jgi:hypothetical protein
MEKFLIAALVLVSFALSGVTSKAQAQPGSSHCQKAPKDPMPCIKPVPAPVQPKQQKR